MTGNNIQLDKNGNLKHFLSIEGLSQPLLHTILNYAESFATVAGKRLLIYSLNPALEPVQLLNSQQKDYLQIYSI